MVVTKKITKIGNSYGVILSSDILEGLGVAPDGELQLTLEHGRLQIESAEARQNKVLKAAAKYINKYRADFKKLAE